MAEYADNACNVRLLFRLQGMNLRAKGASQGWVVDAPFWKDGIGQNTILEFLCDTARNHVLDHSVGETSDQMNIQDRVSLYCTLTCLFHGTLACYCELRIVHAALAAANSAGGGCRASNTRFVQ